MGKHLVLFSDGTGNSSGKLFKTNVWRVYEAVDLTDPQHPTQPRQFSYYDDGVGTSSFKPLALLGGAFGVGLARNVLDLYVFLCRMWQPGDRIYAFGFSRGAFTIRVLVGLVATQGLLRYCGNEAELQRLARDAYRAYRRKRFQGSALVRVARATRDAWLDAWNALLGRQRYDEMDVMELAKCSDEGLEGTPPPKAERADDDCKVTRATGIEIEFLGLWDTVDAYGLPVDELTKAIDWIWPLTMRDCNLSRQVRRACHALALDDERNAFHPRLWNERPDPDKPGVGVQPDGNLATTHIRQETVSQVWFAGVHSNVGGGYPDDGLAHVSLQWIMDEAEHHGLRFERAIRRVQRALADENGPIYDSRHGLGGYYRYNPRRIERLVDTKLVKIGRVKVHESVLRRMRAGHDSYAPIVLPPGFAVVKVDGDIVDGDAYLHALSRSTLEASATATLSRSVLVAVTQACAARTRTPLAWLAWQAAAALVAWPTVAAQANRQAADPAGAGAAGVPAVAAPASLVGEHAPYKARREHVYNWVWWRRVAYFHTVAVTLVLAALPLFKPGTDGCDHWLCFVAAPLEALGRLLPSSAATWAESFAAHPEWSVPLLAAVFAGLLVGGMLEVSVRDQMRRVWYAIPRLRPASVERMAPPRAPGPLLRAVEGLRNHPAYRPALLLLTQWVLPAAFLLVLGYGALALVSQIEFARRVSSGDICQAAESGWRGVGMTDAVESTFRTTDPCASTGAEVEKGATYRVRITVPANKRWLDKDIPAGPNGFECRLPFGRALLLGSAVPLRRHLTEPWFQPMARIGKLGNDTYPLRGMPRTPPARDRCGNGKPMSPATGHPAPAPASPADEVFESFFVARLTGPLFVYVNDAIGFYGNNEGEGRVEVSLVRPAPPPAPQASRPAGP